jgi:uncharacterized protein YbjT (DUF2867 family)
MSPYRALVIGATGAVGSALLRELRHSEACAEIVALTRRPLSGQNATHKMRVHVIDFDHLEEATREHAAGCAVAFCTMGVGQPRKVSLAHLKLVDVDYAGAFARGAASGGVRHISLLSSVAASLESRNPYLRMKGLAERVVADAAIARTSLFRPSVLRTRRIRYGMQDRLTQALFPAVSLCLPSRYRAVRIEDLGRALRVNAERQGAPGVETLEYPQFQELIAKGA